MPKVCPVCDTKYADTDTFCENDGANLLVVNQTDELIGRSFGNYEIGALLGRGGMGNVYLAHHKTLKQKAAIKILKFKMQSDPDAAERFKREARNAHRLEHENIVRIFDFGEDPDGLLYLVMEYVPGRSLRTLLERNGALTLTRTSNIVTQVARGLDAAHELKIIHRDVKPDNIMIVEAPNGNDRVKIVDFGIARIFEASEQDGAPTQETLTGFNSVIGTPEYMSPEQLTGKRLDGRSDTYALALVAYQCLTVKLPFAGETPSERTWTRLTSKPLKLVDLVSGAWSPLLQAALDAALAREPELRPSTAGAFAQRMSEAINGAARSTKGGDPRWWQKTNRVAAAAAAAIVLVAMSVYAMRVMVAKGKDTSSEMRKDSMQVATTGPTPEVDSAPHGAGDTPNVIARDSSKAPATTPRHAATGDVIPSRTKEERPAANEAENTSASVRAIRSWLATSDVRLSDQSNADLTSAADSVLTIFGRVDPIRLMPTADDSVRAYLVWANAVLRRSSTDDVAGACKILKQASALRLRPRAQTLRARYQRSLESCGNE